MSEWAPDPARASRVEGADVVSACQYQDPKATLTLREGLEEYRRANAGKDFLEEEDLMRESGTRTVALFHNHDIVHVVFGLSTKLRHEVLADTWTFAGADIPWREYLAYLTEPAAQGVIKDTGYLRTAWTSLLTIPAAFRVLANARRMTRKWPFDGHHDFLDRALCEIRRDFGIKLVD